MTETARNLLIVMSDEHRRDAMGCMGHPIVRTPHLDALAARGALFTNAYTPSPMCVPARAALACGDHVHRTGYWDSAAPYDGARRSWMHAVREAGAQTASIGKLHFRSSADDNGFDEEILPMHVVDGTGWTVGLLRHDPPPFSAAAEFARDVGPGESDYTEYDRAICAAAEAWLSDPARRARPWAAFVSLVSPHYPLRAPEPYFALYPPEAMDPPIAYAAGERPTHPELTRVAAFFDYDRHFDADGVLRAKAAYYGLTSFMDACVGRVLAALEASGQAEETLVVYASDHGDMLGDHGLWTKQVMYEASVGAPMIAAGPGVAAGRRVATGASLIDIAATAVEAFGAPALGTKTSTRSLRALAAAPDDPERTAFSEYHDGGSTTGTFMVRWGRWKSIQYADAPAQLFDLEADPQERRDLLAEDSLSDAAAAAAAEGVRRLREICDPAEVDARCFADQRARIEAFGGEDACRAVGFNHTPTPL